MLIQSILIEDKTQYIVFSPKVPQKEFGNYVLTLMLVESQYLKLQNGIKNSSKLTLNLVKTEKEF